MYADDSVMCCLFPSQCNMYPQTTGVIFWEIMEYLNMMMVIISPIFIAWSIVKIALKLLENKKCKLIEHNVVEKKSIDELILKNLDIAKYNYDGDGDKTCSDSDLSVPLKPTIQKYNKPCLLDDSNADSSFSEIIKDTCRRSSCNSSDQCFPSSSEETAQFDHLFDEHYYLLVEKNGKSSKIVPEKEIMREIQETTNSDQLKDKLPIMDSGSNNHQKCQNILVDIQS
ncbi:uncharacterized protein LOC114126760 [Aphis gossypii]|uniref:Uncharacterized protein n=1 Tax=Aphis gossypii TaxID=80765 RepID=A0A9P0J929_APHGO|nr:uncharacterized protein LOC114126760 [Aphis gossypii]CAH1732588.1 unnamed protein product [Aphis gossypii]